jgi:hypothetical protein
MANEHELSYTAEEIDERLGLAGSSVLFTEQMLTEEQKAQVRANIGAKAEGNSNVTIKDVQYYYDGDNESDKHEFVQGATDEYKPFVKIADIPDGGKVNLVGGSVSVKGENQFLDFYFDITQDMLSQSVEKMGLTISAVVPNKLTQIFYQSGADVEPFTYVVICEKPGRYDIAFETWFTNIYFPTPGVYLMDGRTYQKKSYVEYLNAKIVSVSDDEKRPTDYVGNEIQLFNKGICIGDSITEGFFEHSGGNAIIKEYSYPTYLTRMTGVELVNSGVSGFTSKQWHDASVDSESVGGKWVNGQWVWNLYPEVGESDIVSSSLDFSDCDFAIIHLGINDTNTIGDDVTIEQAISTFESSINGIIANLKASSKGIKVFLATIIPYHSVNDTFEQFNSKIREIAEQTTDVYLLDLTTYSDCYGDIYGHGYHLTALGYHKMASEISAYISYIISQNLEDFKWVQFIGTTYTA